jgi:electron transport complex protein RnfE
MRDDGGLARGVFGENPIFTFLLGLCPALAVSTRVADAIVLSLGVLFVMPGAAALARPLSRVRREALRSFLSAGSVAVLVTVFDLLVGWGLPLEREHLGIYLPVLAANCLILGRLEMGTRSGGEGDPFTDAVGLGLGFGASLLLIAVLRETLGAGRITLFPAGSFSGTVTLGGLAVSPVRVLVLPAGGLMLLGYLVGLKRALFDGKGKRPR